MLVGVIFLLPRRRQSFFFLAFRALVQQRALCCREGQNGRCCRNVQWSRLCGRVLSKVLPERCRAESRGASLRLLVASGVSPSPQERRWGSRLSPVHDRLASLSKVFRTLRVPTAASVPLACCILVSAVRRMDWMRILRPCFDCTIMKRLNDLQRFFISPWWFLPGSARSFKPQGLKDGGVISLSCRLRPGGAASSGRVQSGLASALAALSTLPSLSCVLQISGSYCTSVS